MSIDYGARIRAVADYLEKVPGEKYAFEYGPSRVRGGDDGGGCGCVITHGYNGGVIPWFEFSPYDNGAEWMGFAGSSEFHTALTALEEGAIGRGEDAKQAAIRALRFYADAHYPLTPKRSGIPSGVLRLFEQEEAA